MTTTSALYVGHLSHARGGGQSNHFRYRVWFAALDVDELPRVAETLTLLSHNRRNVYSLFDADYAGTAGTDLRGSIEEFARAGGIAEPLGRIVLLTQLRAFGWVFNPVSFFFCYSAGGAADPVCTVAEVNNTYGGSHRYLLDARNRIPGERLRHRTDKALYVSPFLADDLVYDWDVSTARGPELPQRHDVQMVLRRHGRRVFAARLRGTKRQLRDLQLLKLLVSHPLMPQQVLAKIHLQALKLRAKGLQFRLPHPPHHG